MALGAFLDGIRRVAAAPLLFLGVYAVTAAASLPAALALRGPGGMETSGAETSSADTGGTEAGSADAEAVAALFSGLPAGGCAAFSVEAAGVARTVGPLAADWGAVAVVDIDAKRDGAVDAVPDAAADTGAPAGTVAEERLAGIPFPAVPGLPAGAVAGLAVSVAVWTFLAGGTLDRLARQRADEGAFLAACRRHFWPLARLALLAGVLYWLLFGMPPPGFAAATARDPAAGFAADPAAFALHALLAAVAAAAGLLFDYARVRTVVEDRRSVVGALLAAFRFARRRPAAVSVLWLANTALLALVLTGCALTAPAARAAAPPTWAPLLAGQFVVAGRLLTTLVAWASQTAYFQSQLAHPTYVARARVTTP